MAHLEMTEAMPHIAETLANPDTIVRSRTDTTVELFKALSLDSGHEQVPVYGG
jgi:hypothetical protein